MARPLTPEDFEQLKPTFTRIKELIAAGEKEGKRGMTEGACGLYLESLSLMNGLNEEVRHMTGQGIKGQLNRIVRNAQTPEGAGLLGGLGASTLALTQTGLGGFGIAAGGGAIGVSGVAGAAVATGGAGLAGAAALYLLYRGGTAAAKTEMGQKAVDQVQQAGRNASAQLNRLRNRKES